MTADVVAPSRALDPTSTSSTPVDAATPADATFTSLGLPGPLERAVADLGFVTPSAIQAQAIPALLSGRDITGVAQTGTGKTAAFGLPLLAAIDPAQRHVQALVLTPTRELAMQVADAIESFAAHLPKVDVVAVYGGSPYQPQQRALAAGAQVVVGTPGRVIDHLERGTLVLDDVRFLVLDEADEMLRMGFAEDVESIFSRAPRERQVALFSATMPAPIRRVAAEHLVDPVEIAVARQSSTVTSVRQTYAVVPFRHKTGSLVRVLATSDADAAIVFTRTRGAAEEVGSALVERGISAATISGDVAQKEREKIVERLRSGALDVLVATDVAARGLDVDRIGLVVNFDLPGEPEAYVHRIGRTGRAGRTGEALSFVTPHERGRLRAIERTTRTPLEEVEIPSPADVSAHKARRLLEQVPARREAGRLSMYADMVRGFVAEHDVDPVDGVAPALDPHVQHGVPAEEPLDAAEGAVRALVLAARRAPQARLLGARGHDLLGGEGEVGERSAVGHDGGAARPAPGGPDRRRREPALELPAHAVGDARGAQHARRAVEAPRALELAALGRARGDPHPAGDERARDELVVQVLREPARGEGRDVDALGGRVELGPDGDVRLDAPPRR
ncbi:DEAD/DEAH box helicase, partial [Cellulosimicrobium cellulans]|uniref:DEAD/DEAH box helicase n=1 Tax=Cellulosimicrobium cellulans TaxID=1710 RepID=UPI000A3E1276